MKRIILKYLFFFVLKFWHNTAHSTKDRNTMTIREAMQLAPTQSRTNAIFYRPGTDSAAIYSYDDESGRGWVLWCDCGLAANLVQAFGAEHAYEQVV
jgi:hypothetical protein